MTFANTDSKAMKDKMGLEEGFECKDKMWSMKDKIGLENEMS